MRFIPKSKKGKAALGSFLAAAAIVGSCEIQSARFDGASLPCQRPNLPDVAGAEPLAENLCIAVSGEQPARVGIERSDLGNGRIANTLFLEWNFDGATEGIRVHKPDAEPITLITQDGRPMEVHIRSHWRVGRFDFGECQHNGRVTVAIANSFHTPIVAGCEPTVVDTAARGGINTFVFNTIYHYGRAAGQTYNGSFQSLGSYTNNEAPGPDHRCREQPLFDRSAGQPRIMMRFDLSGPDPGR
jgi:hypothetical protein